MMGQSLGDWDWPRKSLYRMPSSIRLCQNHRDTYHNGQKLTGGWHPLGIQVSRTLLSCSLCSSLSTAYDINARTSHEVSAGTLVPCSQPIDGRDGGGEWIRRPESVAPSLSRTNGYGGSLFLHVRNIFVIWIRSSLSLTDMKKLHFSH